MAQYTKKDYENHLNDNSPEQGSDKWIIGGTIRMAAMWKQEYGTALRKHDPIAFEVGYNEWKRNKNS
jgi:hypothetical protein